MEGVLIAVGMRIKCRKHTVHFVGEKAILEQVVAGLFWGAEDHAVLARDLEASLFI